MTYVLVICKKKKKSGKKNDNKITSRLIEVYFHFTHVLAVVRPVGVGSIRPTAPVGSAIFSYTNILRMVGELYRSYRTFTGVQRTPTSMCTL